jgi:hypothetical protein
MIFRKRKGAAEEGYRPNLRDSTERKCADTRLSQCLRLTGPHGAPCSGPPWSARSAGFSTGKYCAASSMTFVYNIPRAILLIASTPVDVLTYAAWKWTSCRLSDWLGNISGRPVRASSRDSHRIATRCQSRYASACVVMLRRLPSLPHHGVAGSASS